MRAANEYIAAGDAFQIVLSQRFSRRTSSEPFSIYRALRALNPSPYMFFLRFDDDLSLIGASPEMMVRLEDGTATVRPIAGTRPRGKTDAEDDALAAELLRTKERVEHVMLWTWAQRPGPRVRIRHRARAGMMVIERYSDAMHIVTVEGGCARHDGVRPAASDVLAGTLSGAPKVRDGDHRGVGRHGAGYTWRRGRLLQLRRLDGHVHHDPHDGHARGYGHVPRARASWRTATRRGSTSP